MINVLCVIGYNACYVTDDVIYAKKKDQRREELQAEQAKENTFRPQLVTKRHKAVAPAIRKASKKS